MVLEAFAVFIVLRKQIGNNVAAVVNSNRKYQLKSIVYFELR